MSSAVTAREALEHLGQLARLALEHEAAQAEADDRARILEPEHELAAEVAVRLRELVGGHRLVAQLAQLAEDRAHGLVGPREIDAGLRVQRAGVEVLAVLREHVVGEPAALAHLGEEARRHAAAEHRGRELHDVAIGVPDRQAVAADAQVELVGVLRVQPNARRAGAGRNGS